MIVYMYIIKIKRLIYTYQPQILSLFHLDQSVLSLKPMESCSCPRINYYSRQVVHGNLSAQIFGPVPSNANFTYYLGCDLFILVASVWIRTRDLQLMRLTSYHCYTPQYISKNFPINVFIPK